jgi:hypothetical protein
VLGLLRNVPPVEEFATKVLRQFDVLESAG